jgi:hypothetical protein
MTIVNIGSISSATWKLGNASKLQSTKDKTHFTGDEPKAPYITEPRKNEVV